MMSLFLNLATTLAFAAPEVVTGHLLYRKGQVYFSPDAAAQAPEYLVEWRTTPPPYRKLCFFNFNHACRRIDLNIESVNHDTHHLVGASLTSAR